MRELLLVRHAQVQPGPPRMDDVHRLSEHGRRQARSLARRLKRAQVKPDVIYSSALLRARQTTEILNAQLNARVEIRRDLIEHGSEMFLQDCTIQDLVKRHPDKFHDDGEIRYPKSNNGLTWAFSVCGEDMRALHARARVAWTYIRTQHPLGKPGTVLVVSHGSFLAAFLSELMGLPLTPVDVEFFVQEHCLCPSALPGRRRFDATGDEHRRTGRRSSRAGTRNRMCHCS
jgi:broad specificity phosphatase PhoE